MPTFGLSSAAQLGMQALGVRNDPYAAFSFLVEIEGLIVGGFTEVSGLRAETAVEEYREGGVNTHSHKLPGPTSYPANLVFRHGLTDIDTMWRWYHDVARGVIKRRNGTIYLLNQQRIPAVWWTFKEAIPIAWAGPELRADASQEAVESVELIHRGIERSGAAMAALGAAAKIAGDVF